MLTESLQGWMGLSGVMVGLSLLLTWRLRQLSRDLQALQQGLAVLRQQLRQAEQATKIAGAARREAQQALKDERHAAGAQGKKLYQAQLEQRRLREALKQAESDSLQASRSRPASAPPSSRPSGRPAASDSAARGNSRPAATSKAPAAITKPATAAIEPAKAFAEPKSAAVPSLPETPDSEEPSPAMAVLAQQAAWEIERRGLAARLRAAEEALQKEGLAHNETRHEGARQRRRCEDLRRIDIISRSKLAILEDRFGAQSRLYYEVVSELAAERGEVVPPGRCESPIQAGQLAQG